MVLRLRNGNAVHRFRPRLEELEGRMCLSVTVATVVVNGHNELQITGDSAADTVNIADQGNGDFTVTDGGGATLGTGTAISAVKFDGKDGTDTLTYTLVNPLTNSESIYVKLGSGGSGSANFDFSAGFNGAEMHLNAYGSANADTLTGTLGALVNAHVGVNLDGRGGDDIVTLQGPAANVDADSTLHVRLEGGRGDDGINAALAGQVNGKLKISADGGKGTDTLVSELTVEAGSTGRVTDFAKGGRGTDSVTLNVTDNSAVDASTLAALHAKIFDPSGEDTLVHTDNVDVLVGHHGSLKAEHELHGLGALARGHGHS